MRAPAGSSGRRIGGAVLALALAVGATLGTAQPATAAEPSVIVASAQVGDVDFRLDVNVTIYPWRFFGKNLPIGGANARFESIMGWRDTQEGVCLFGLAWNIAVADTPANQVRFTCAEFGTTRIYPGTPVESSYPYLRVNTYTIVEGAAPDGRVSAYGQEYGGAATVTFD